VPSPTRRRRHPALTRAGQRPLLTLRNATLRRNAPQGLLCFRKAGGDATLSDGTFPAPGGPAAYACDR